MPARCSPDKTVVAVSGPALDWQQIVTAGAEQGATFLALPATEHVPLLGARAALREYHPRGLRGAAPG